MSRAAELEDDDGPATDRPMTLGQHLDELRRRLLRAVIYAIAGMALCATFEDELVGFVLTPYIEVLRQVPGAKGELQATQVSELFFARMWLDVIVGLFVAGPFILLEVWGFIAKGLYEKERRWVRVFAPLSLFLFVEGCAFYYFLVQPQALSMLLTYGTDVPVLGGALTEKIAVRLSVDNAIRFYLVMSGVMGLTFQLPLGMVFVQKLGIASWRTYSRYRKHFFMGSLVGMAILTPSGDAATLAICMVPVLFLFEAGLVVCWLMDPRIPRDADAEETT